MINAGFNDNYDHITYGINSKLIYYISKNIINSYFDLPVTENDLYTKPLNHTVDILHS